ncbi:MAG TPA: branched-chain amino acid ABC transporter permease [bacterium]|nr:branched-chain amino acid ABC transporter permease [bacterium]
MHLILNSFGFGLVTASVLALAAVGVTLQFGVTNYVNFAYGEYLTLGAYLSWILNVQLHVDFWLAAVGGAVATGVGAVVISEFVLKPFVRRGARLLFLLIVTLGMSLILANIFQILWGTDFRKFDIPNQQVFSVGPLIFTPNQVIIMAIGLGAMLAIHWLLKYTKLGKAMRAMSDNLNLARVGGVDTDRVTLWTWFISGCLAGLAGVMLALSAGGFQPSFGEEFLFVIFAAVIVGGVGQPYGAMLGALTIGSVTEMSAAVLNSALKSDVAFLVLIVMILIRPQGLIPTQGKA